MTAAPDLPAEAEAWVAAHATGRVLAVTRTGTGVTGSTWRVDVEDAEPLVLRRLDTRTWGGLGRDQIRREASALRTLAGSAVPVAELLAVDVDGRHAGAPASLAAWLPGRVRHDRLSVAALTSWATVAAAVHRRAVAPASRPPSLAPRGPADPQVPGWTNRPALWAAAIDRVRAGPPTESRNRLIHRDFHLGNVVWSADAVSGVIDWTQSSWGPAELDVAHACADLALLGFVDDVPPFRAAYRNAGGVLADPATAAYWVLVDVIGFLPDPPHVLPAFTATRPELTAADVQGGLEGLLALALDRDLGDDLGDDRPR